MAPAGGFRALFAAAAAVGAVVTGLAAVSTVTTAAQVQQPFPAPLPVSCDDSPRVRKEAGSLTAAEWATYQRAVNGLHERETSDNRATFDWFERFITMHEEYAKAAHNGAHFLAWHRLFLLAYENALRTVEPTVTIPYWDWSMDAQALELAPVWVAGRLGGAKKDGDIVGGAFDKFHVDTGDEGPHNILRGFQSQKRGSMRRLSLSFADKATMEALWSNQDMNFQRFSTALEAEHGMVHVVVGGSKGDMVDLAKAAGDVVFWSHHAYIDYIWSRRQEALPSERYVGKQGPKDVSLDDILAPFNTKVRYAAELKCVQYIADPREIRPPPSVADLPVTSPPPSVANPPVTSPAPSVTNPPVTVPPPSVANLPVATSAPSVANPPVMSPAPSVANPPVTSPAPSVANLPVTSPAPSVANLPVTSLAPSVANPPVTVPPPTVANPPVTPPQTSVTPMSTAADVNLAWLPCASDADCGCGSCVNRACVVDPPARTVAPCGAVAKCIRHPNKTVRQLVCRCIDAEKCQCTRSADCGCGVCRRSDGTCQAPRAVRLASYCGPRSACVKRCAKARKYTCTRGIRCRRHADCGCGICFRKRCMTRRRRTLRTCGLNHSCVLAGAKLACKAKRMALPGLIAGHVAAALQAAGIMRMSADSVANAARKKLHALAKFQKMFEEASENEAKVVAEARQETKMALAEADADADVVEALAVAAKKRLAAKAKGRMSTTARGSTLGVMARAATDAKKIALLEADVQKQSADVRKQARHELWQAEKEAHRRLRKIALTGFTAVNNLDTTRFLSGEQTMKQLVDKVDVKAEAKAVEGAEADEDAELEDGTTED